LTKETIRRFFRPRASGWRFQAAYGTLRYEAFNPHRLEDPPDRLLKADAVLARGLSWDAPDDLLGAMVRRLEPLFGEECVILTGPGEFWPELSDFNLEVRDGVSYYRKPGRVKEPRPAKKPHSLTVPFSTPSNIKSLFWLAEEKLLVDPEAARELAAELIHEEALLGYINPDSLEVAQKAEMALNRPNAAAAAAETIAQIKSYFS
jgi:hypothetical protein